MSILSQLFILSPRGDKLVFKDYRQDLPRNADEYFFRKFKFWDNENKQHPAPSGGDCPPFFVEKKICFAYVRKNGIIFAAALKHWDVSPCLVSEILFRLCRILKDFLGVLSEEKIRSNFTLVYEILDEMLDSGVIQELSTERLRPYIAGAPDIVTNGGGSDKIDKVLDAAEMGFNTIFGGKKPLTRKSDDSQRSVMERRNEIYIDVIERVSAVFAAEGGHMISADVNGSITMKSFLAGSPVLKIGFNEDLAVGRTPQNRYSSVILDSCNFHDTVNFTDFESQRYLTLQPPDGEFALMSYRFLKQDFPPPFKITPSIEVASDFKIELILRVRADLMSNLKGINCIIKCPVPKCTTSVGFELGVGPNASDQKTEYRSAEKVCVWTIPTFMGGAEHVCKIGIALERKITPYIRRELSPLTMNFEIPNHNISGLAIKSLILNDGRAGSNAPQRWVRNITQATSYVTRLK